MNIDPKKYRLGNLLREVESKQIIEVIGLKKETHTRTGFNEEIIKYENLIVEFSGSFPDGWQAEEILLTEDLLLKIGFIKKDNDLWCCYCFDGFCLSSNFELFLGNDSDLSYIKILTLSKLQNTYFELYSKELDLSALEIQPTP